MGLPNKKQLHQHKRGTRKALDTLAEMDGSPERMNKDANSESVVQSGVVNERLARSSDRAVMVAAIMNAIPDEKSAGTETTGDPKQHEEAVHNAVTSSAKLRQNQSSQPAEKDVMTATSSTPSKKRLDLGNPEEDSTSDSLGFQDAGSDDTEDASDDLIPEVVRRDEYFEDDEDTQKDKYLTFCIGKESFGFSIRFVTEIIVIHRITEVPDTPAFVRGVINLRGKVIPVMDVRHRFGLELKDYDERTCIIVVDHSDTAVGLIVDTVKEVVDIPESEIDPPPRTHSGIETGYIQGMGKIGKQVTILLDLEKVLFVKELKASRKAVSSS